MTKNKIKNVMIRVKNEDSVIDFLNKQNNVNSSLILLMRIAQKQFGNEDIFEALLADKIESGFDPKAIVDFNAHQNGGRIDILNHRASAQKSGE